MIEVVHLHKQFANKQIFHEYNNKFPNAKTCVLGENGVGKTTLFTLIAGLDPYFSGRILLAGKHVKSLQERVALASDKIPFPEFLTAQQILAMTGSAWQCELPLTLAEEFGFSAFLETRVSDLSSGNYKKLQLLNAIMRGTEYLILDEPSAALDQHGVDTICQWLGEFNGHVLISSHEPQPFLNIGFVSQPLFNQ